MKHALSFSLVLIIALFLATPTLAQNDVAQSWQMTPRLGHASSLKAALAAHAKWRMDHDDPWSWGVTEVITGDKVGTYMARSGGHTWKDFDDYGNWAHGEAAELHFESTVAPHLASLRSTITVGDEENLRWPESPDDARVMMVVGLDMNNGMMEDYIEVIAEYHKAIVEHDFDGHHYIAYNVSGGEYDVYLVFPGSSMADFANPEETVEQLMTKVHGEEKFKEMQETANAAVKDGENFMIVAHPELSVTQADSN